MSTPVRVGAFVVGLALVLLAGLGLGRWLGPDPETTKPTAGHAHGDTTTTPQNKDDADMHGGHASSAAPESLTDGLSATRDGHTLRLLGVTPKAGGRSTLSFLVEGAEGPVSSYDVVHTKRLHLIVVRRDLTGFQHVHPTLTHDGVWVADVRLTPGAWRVFADFTPTGGRPLVLGADLNRPGRASVAVTERTRNTDRVGPLTVTLDGTLQAGAHSMLGISVTRGGEPVEVQPYLGARGHLVALRESDLAYLHVHPMGDDARRVEFGAEVPTPGRYHLYFDFRVDGVVHTADFVVIAGEGGHDHS